MKLTDDTKQKAKLPDFWREGWLEEALHELETSNLTPEQRAMYEITIAGNMSEKYAREAEIQGAVEEAVKKAVEKAEREAERRAEEAKEGTAIKLIKRKGLTDEEIAQVVGIPISSVERLRSKVEH